VGPIAGLHAVAQRKNPSPESNLGRPSRSLVTLYTRMHKKTHWMLCPWEFLRRTIYAHGFVRTDLKMEP